MEGEVGRKKKEGIRRVGKEERKVEKRGERGEKENKKMSRQRKNIKEINECRLWSLGNNL